MFKKLSTYLTHIYKRAREDSNNNVKEILSRTGPHNSLLDVGCWDGTSTIEWSRSAKAKKIFGIETVKLAALKSAKKGIDVKILKADTEKWPFKSASINCVVSNMLIEHLSDLDHFFSEASRVLIPGGFMVTSTNNLASWHNIVSLIFGWAPFDLANSSSKTWAIGNPLSPNRTKNSLHGITWTHKCVYTPKWLTEWGLLYNLTLVEIKGAGYYPLPSLISRFDPTHSAFISIVQMKTK